ncbi:MAG TPA: alpha/beta hydrolase [Edaphobacter sp.]|nr:alpha/beta hydrolase [Edaphobacter sp.]
MGCRRTRCVHFFLIFLLAVTLHAQEITGNWQGLLGGKFRVVLQITKSADGKLQGNLYRIDQSPHSIPVTTLSFVSPTLKLTIDELNASYEVALSTDGKTMTGTLTSGQATSLILYRANPETAWKFGSSSHTVQMVSVEKGVSLEVLDWGGRGRPLVLLTGLGDTAHVFDEFAPKLTASYHVYGITRRGRGASSTPEPNATNYSADRLGEDVLAVIDALHLNKPLLAGHSMAGEELTYIGSHYPEKVAGLIYMEAGYPYALYDQTNGELELDAIELRNQLRQFINGYALEPVKDYDNLIANLQRVEKEVKEQQQDTGKLPPTPVSPRMTPDLFAILEGRERFTTIHALALVIMGDEDNPHPASEDDPKSRAEAVRQALEIRNKKRQVAAFERQVPSAHMVLIPHATHYVFQSNEADVLREMNTFIATLPPAN